VLSATRVRALSLSRQEATMRLTLALTLFLSAAPALAGPPLVVDFDDGHEGVIAAAKAGDGALFFVGMRIDFATALQDIALLKTSASGVPDPTFGVNGQVTIPANSNSTWGYFWPREVAATSDGGCVVVGLDHDEPPGAYSLGYVAKVRANGALE